MQRLFAKRNLRRILLAVALAGCLLLGLFVLNGVMLGYGTTPRLQTTDHQTAEPAGATVKIMAFNIAKCFVHQGGVSFEERGVVHARLERMAELIRAEQPDLLFLSEAVLECTPCNLNQVDELARRCGMHTWAFGENFNVGWPCMRMISGNAILSRWPLEPVGNPSLAGRRPFYLPRNNRRVLWCRVKLAGQPLLLASVHNDSFDLANNEKQVEQILDFIGTREALLAGDFNAEPGDASIERLRRTGRFAGDFDGEKTYPADRPTRQIDFILAPASWQLIAHRVIETEVSDHRPVVSEFRLPGVKAE